MNEKTCGSNGGRNLQGAPCAVPVGLDANGRCHAHPIRVQEQALDFFRGLFESLNNRLDQLQAVQDERETAASLFYGETTELARLINIQLTRLDQLKSSRILEKESLVRAFMNLISEAGDELETRMQSKHYILGSELAKDAGRQKALAKERDVQRRAEAQRAAVESKKHMRGVFQDFLDEEHMVADPYNGGFQPLVVVALSCANISRDIDRRTRNLGDIPTRDLRVHEARVQITALEKLLSSLGEGMEAFAPDLLKLVQIERQRYNRRNKAQTTETASELMEAMKESVDG